MSEYPSSKGSARRQILWDETGSAVSEWVVAAAIVGLFSIPVLALINSGAQTRSEPVVAAMEDPKSNEAGKAYGVGGAGGEDGGTFGGAGDENGSAQTAEPTGYSGLNKGVGYDIDVSDVTDTDRGSSSGMAVARRRQTGTVGGAPGEANRSDSRTRTEDPSDENRRVLAVPKGESDEDAFRRRVARISSAPRVVRPNTPEEATDITGGAVDIRCGGVEAKSVPANEPDIETQEDLNAALVENVDESKIDALLDNIRIRTLDEEKPAEPDCPEQELAAVAPEQLEDGTILGAVTISTNSDRQPKRRQRPAAIAEVPGLEEATIGQARKSQLNASKLPIPSDQKALGKLLDLNEEPETTLRPLARHAPSPPQPGTRPDYQTSAAEPAKEIAAIASSTLGQEVVSNPAIDVINFEMHVASRSELSVGARSSASVVLSIELPKINKRAVPILRSGR